MLLRLLALLGWVAMTSARMLPLVYHPTYNVHFYGLEALNHRFDTQKYRKIFHALAEKFGFSQSNVHAPQDLSIEELEEVHTREYLDNLKKSSVLAQVAEVPLLKFLPNSVLQRRIIQPMRLATAGTVLAAELALKTGWAINIGGGFHHAKMNNGEGFCFFADIPLAIKRLFDQNKVHKVLIVDLDAHQGNGYLTIFTNKGHFTDSSQGAYVDDPRVAVFDMYNADIYPADSEARHFITYHHPLRSHTADALYLRILRTKLPLAMDSSAPDLVVYNAGTDIYEKDPLGALAVSMAGIQERDEFVFQQCRQRNIPIVMVLSGGYTTDSSIVITNSITNLHEKGLIDLNMA